MPRIRTVKPEFWTHPEILRLSIPARLLLVCLFNLADDEGRLYDQPMKIRGESFGEKDRINILTLLHELDSEGRILRYEVDGRECIQVVNFRRHQSISHPRPSSIPPPQNPGTLREGSETDSGDAPGTLREGSGGEWKGMEEEGKGKEGKGTDVVGTEPLAASNGETTVDVAGAADFNIPEDVLPSELAASVTHDQAYLLRKAVTAQPAFAELKTSQLQRISAEHSERVLTEVLMALVDSAPTSVDHPAAYVDEITARVVADAAKWADAKRGARA